MARVKSLDPARRQLDGIIDFILRKMRENGIRQSDLAAEIGTSQQNVSRKIKSGNIRTLELLRILNKVGASGEEIGKLIEGRR